MAEDLRAIALAAVEDSNATSDPDYPMLHLAPPVGRLNDPNGLIYWDGKYHACYQFSPFHPNRKLVYWGHAVSTDLVTWQQEDPAIVPDSWYDKDGAYSGSAIEHDGVVYFAYTGNVRYPDGGRDAFQSLVSTSDMQTFSKYPQNPVLPKPPAGYTAHVRDPQVWREGDRFRMCLGAQRENLTGAALLFSSPDLIEWQFDGELEFPGTGGRFDSLGYMWECPAIIQVPDETTGQVFDVLVFCPQGVVTHREGFENIFPACYLVGKLEGNAFWGAGEIEEIDRGFEFYAPQSFANVPGRTIMLAWAGNASEDAQPSIEHGWVHTMSLARELSLRDGRLIQRPQLPTDRASQVELPELAVGAQWQPIESLVQSRVFRARFTVELAEGERLSVRIGSPSSHVDIELGAQSLVVDRSTTRYAAAAHRSVTLPARASREVEIVHDRSVTELFFDGGELSFTMRSYLEGVIGGLEVSSSPGVTLQHFTAAQYD